MRKRIRRQDKIQEVLDANSRHGRIFVDQQMVLDNQISIE